MDKRFVFLKRKIFSKLLRSLRLIVFALSSSGRIHTILLVLLWDFLSQYRMDLGHNRVSVIYSKSWSQIPESRDKRPILPTGRSNESSSSIPSSLSASESLPVTSGWGGRTSLMRLLVCFLKKENESCSSSGATLL